MLVVERDREGRIVAVRQGKQGDGGEPASLLDEEVLAFLRQSGEIDALAHLLALSDTSIIRVLEDLIDVLVAKNVILFTDLPEEAQAKIRARKEVRLKMGGESLMVDDIL